MFYLINTTFHHVSIRCKARSILFNPLVKYSSGPSPKKLKAIPFAQHVKAAEKVKKKKIYYTKKPVF